MSRRRTDDAQSFFEYNVNLAQRIMYLGSATSDEHGETGVDHRMAENAIKGLILLDTMDRSGNSPITIVTNNPGGEEYHGLAIFDAIRSCKNPVDMLVYGMAMSMGAWILQAATKRILAPNARVMIHYGTWGIPEEHPQIVYRWADESKKIDRIMEDTFLARIREKHPEFTRKKLQNLLQFDTILSAQEAVALGLADEVLGVNSEDQENEE